LRVLRNDNRNYREAINPWRENIKTPCSGMTRARGKPYHPMTQGKIERCHHSMKNQVLLENYYLPGQLEARLAEFVDYYNTRRARSRPPSRRGLWPSRNIRSLERTEMAKAASRSK